MQCTQLQILFKEYDQFPLEPSSTLDSQQCKFSEMLAEGIIIPVHHNIALPKQMTLKSYHIQRSFRGITVNSKAIQRAVRPIYTVMYFH
jgi:hypothetical protein